MTMVDGLLKQLDLYAKAAAVAEDERYAREVQKIYDWWNKNRNPYGDTNPEIVKQFQIRLGKLARESNEEIRATNAEIMRNAGKMLGTEPKLDMRLVQKMAKDSYYEKD